jgi:putative lipoprotein
VRGLRRLSVLTLCVALVAGACGDDDDDDAAGETAAETDGEFSSPLGGTAWILEPASIDVVIPEGGEEVTLAFSTDGSFAGHAGCNNYTGSYSTTDDGGITVSDPAITRMMCEDNVMAVETAYLAALAQVAQFAVSGDVLTFSDADGAEVLRYNRG